MLPPEPRKIEVSYQEHVISILNVPMSWKDKAKYLATTKYHAWMRLCEEAPNPFGKDKPVSVTITRHGLQIMDGDNFQGSMKGVRDGIARYLRRDDADPSITWIYHQVKVPHKTDRKLVLTCVGL